eukprot:gene22148-biopygen23696
MVSVARRTERLPRIGAPFCSPRGRDAWLAGRCTRPGLTLVTPPVAAWGVRAVATCSGPASQTPIADLTAIVSRACVGCPAALGYLRMRSTLAARACSGVLRCAALAAQCFLLCHRLRGPPLPQWGSSRWRGRGAAAGRVRRAANSSSPCLGPTVLNANHPCQSFSIFTYLRPTLFNESRRSVHWRECVGLADANFRVVPPELPSGQLLPTPAKLRRIRSILARGRGGAAGCGASPVACSWPVSGRCISLPPPPLCLRRNARYTTATGGVDGTSFTRPADSHRETVHHFQPPGLLVETKRILSVYTPARCSPPPGRGGGTEPDHVLGESPVRGMQISHDDREPCSGRAGKRSADSKKTVRIASPGGGAFHVKGHSSRASHPREDRLP